MVFVRLAVIYGMTPFVMSKRLQSVCMYIYVYIYHIFISYYMWHKNIYAYGILRHFNTHEESANYI